jgi:hypothetical protein
MLRPSCPCPRAGIDRLDTSSLSTYTPNFPSSAYNSAAVPLSPQPHPNALTALLHIRAYLPNQRPPHRKYSCMIGRFCGIVRASSGAQSNTLYSCRRFSSSSSYVISRAPSCARWTQLSYSYNQGRNGKLNPGFDTEEDVMGTHY